MYETEKRHRKLVTDASCMPKPVNIDEERRCDMCEDWSPRKDYEGKHIKDSKEHRVSVAAQVKKEKNADETARHLAPS